MKSQSVLVVFILFFILNFGMIAQNKMSISFPDSSIELLIPGQAVNPQYTPIYNHSDDFLSFKKSGSVYKAPLLDFKRGMSSGRLIFGASSSKIYHISSGYVPKKLSDPLVIRVRIPRGYHLIWCGKIWKKGSAEQKFASYFVAREFPLILVKPESYLTRVSRLNRKDSINVIYVFSDSASKANLPTTFMAVDTAALRVGYFAPTYLERVNRYNKKKPLLTVIDYPAITGLEHYNSSIFISPFRYIRVDGLFHTLFHGGYSKGIISNGDANLNGKYYPSDMLGLYEGLTVFMSLKQVSQENYPAYLSALLYKAKLRPDLADMRTISLDNEFESYYAKGLAFCIYMESQGMNIELFGKWLYSIYFSNKQISIQAGWSDVINWISLYDKKMGEIACKSSRGAYIEGAFQALKEKGWSPIYLREMPAWYDLYIGPYSVRPGGVQLPIDNHPSIKAYPVYLVEGFVKTKIEPDKSNLALRKIKDNPDQEFSIEFSDGITRKVKDNLSFVDGTPYFMAGEINFEKDLNFWSRMTKNID